MAAPAEQYLVAIDLGSSTTRCAIASWQPGGDPILEGYAQTPTSGVAKGVVVDVREAAEGVKAAVEAAAARAGVRVATVFATVATPYARGLSSRGCIGIRHEDKVVRGNDAASALAAARRVSLPSDRAVCEVFSQGFAVDDGRGIRNPVGFTGGRLEAEVHIVTDAAAAHANVEQVLRTARYRLEHVVFGPVAAAEAVLSEEEKRLGGVHVDIGAGTTSIVLYVDSYPRFSRVLPIGCQHITNDLAIGLNTSVAEAEKLKRRYGVLATRRARRGSAAPKVEVPLAHGPGTRTFPLQRLGVIIRARVEEIFQLVRRELGRSGVAEAACARAVLSGGFCRMDRALEAAEKALRRPVRFGAVEMATTLSKFETDPTHAALLGAIARGMVYREHKRDRRFHEGGWRGLIRRIAGWF